MRKDSSINGKKPSHSHGRGAGSVRIIGGQWRGRKLSIIEADGLRPSSDRIRETLFNWLAPYLGGRNCLDLFAGTGVLGFEALSRGAAHVDFVETQIPVFKALNANIAHLSAKATVKNEAANTFLQRAANNANAKKYDIVFIDPPFAENLLEQTIQQLVASECLEEGALVYVECGIKQAFNPPADWVLRKEKQTKQVASRLFVVD